MTDLAAIKAELRTLLEKATPGPWMVKVSGADDDAETLIFTAKPLPGTHAPTLVTIPRRHHSKPDAALIVAAVNALPALLADTPSVEPPIDADLLGMALDLVDEEDMRVGVVGRGRKVDRVVAEYVRLRPSVEPHTHEFRTEERFLVDRYYEVRACKCGQVQADGLVTASDGLRYDPGNAVADALLPTQASDSPEPFDEADNMCPNCITPWKCNGPHLSEQTAAGRRHSQASDSPEKRDG